MRMDWLLQLLHMSYAIPFHIRIFLNLPNQQTHAYKQVLNACCNDVPYNRRAYTCCGDKSVYTNYVTVVPAAMCGGPTLTEYVCCSGSVDGAPSPYGANTGCCGTTDDSAYDKSTHSCCGDSIQEGDACCDSVAFHSSSDLCCDSTVHSNVGQGIQCCGNSTYDSATQLCCNGVVQTPTSADQVCCGTDLFVPTATQVCCGSTIMDTATSSCCGGVVVDINTYNSADFICCGATAYSTQYYDSCCGSSPYLSSFQTCCGSTVIYGQGCCCGKFPFSPVAGKKFSLKSHHHF